MYVKERWQLHVMHTNTARTHTHWVWFIIENGFNLIYLNCISNHKMHHWFTFANRLATFVFILVWNMNSVISGRTFTVFNFPKQNWTHPFHLPIELSLWSIGGNIGAYRLEHPYKQTETSIRSTRTRQSQQFNECNCFSLVFCFSLSINFRMSRKSNRSVISSDDLAKQIIDLGQTKRFTQLQQLIAKCDLKLVCIVTFCCY